MQCSCPDWQVPCKHLAATFYLLAEAFDADPFQILHWRGRDKQTLLARLRARRVGDTDPAESDLDTAVTSSGRRTKAGGAAGRAPKARTAKAEPPAIGAATALTELTSPDLADTVDRFWVAPVPLPPRPPTLDTEVDLLLRQLSAPDAILGGPELTARLRALYAALPAPDSPPR